MRKFCILTFLLFIVSCAANVIRRDAQGNSLNSRRDQLPNLPKSFVKKKVALLSFFNESPYGGDDLGITASEELGKEMSRTDQFLLDPMAKKIFGSSKEIYAGGGAKLVQLSRQAKVNGINFVVFGRVIDARFRERTDEIGLIRQTKSYAESRIEVRLFDVNSNKEIFTEELKGYADDSSYRFFQADQESRLDYRRELLRYSVKVASRRIIPKILSISSKLEWVGRVAKIVGSKIYINAGRTSGINIGDILKVMTEGDEIYDPDTGALIGVAKGEIKGTIEVIDYFGPDGAIAILHSGGSVLEGDFVQLY